MKVIISLFLFFNILIANDATIEVIKKVDALPTIAVEMHQRVMTIHLDYAFLNLL